MVSCKKSTEQLKRHVSKLFLTLKILKLKDILHKITIDTITYKIWNFFISFTATVFLEVLKIYKILL